MYVEHLLSLSPDHFSAGQGKSAGCMALKRRTVAGCLLALLAGCLLHGQALGKSSVQCHAPPPALVQKLPPVNADSKRTHCCSLSACLMPSLQLLRASQHLMLRRLADEVPVLASAFSDSAMHEPSCPPKIHCCTVLSTTPGCLQQSHCCSAWPPCMANGHQISGCSSACATRCFCLSPYLKASASKPVPSSLCSKPVPPFSCGL